MSAASIIRTKLHVFAGNVAGVESLLIWAILNGHNGQLCPDKAANPDDADHLWQNEEYCLSAIFFLTRKNAKGARRKTPPGK